MLIHMESILSFFNSFGMDLLRSVIALFVIIDPLGTIPIFIAITKNQTKKARKEISNTAIITAGILLFVFAIAGTQILSFFGINISSFMIAGGILLFMISIELIIHGDWTFGGNNVSDESGVFPLAFPLLAGPGAIASVLLSFETSGLLLTLFSIMIVMGITYVIYRLSDSIYRVLGRRGSLIITRIFAILVAAIAVQYVVDGLKSF
ncbi:MarC family protein [Candidatus Nitrosocosmicus sp. SS]|nr:MarC family protein [Candidatus Nitrosocosmicus sp. SS]KAF0868606.1 MarC family protein [Candidatus Nitrosocosmicus sp. SS]